MITCSLIIFWIRSTKLLFTQHVTIRGLVHQNTELLCCKLSHCVQQCFPNCGAWTCDSWGAKLNLRATPWIHTHPSLSDYSQNFSTMSVTRHVKLHGRSFPMVLLTSCCDELFVKKKQLWNNTNRNITGNPGLRPSHTFISVEYLTISELKYCMPHNKLNRWTYRFQCSSIPHHIGDASVI